MFLNIPRAGRLSAAARLLQVDQSTMSRRLAALEVAAGARLFDRTPDGYALTAAGEAVCSRIEDLESQALASERQLLGQDARPHRPGADRRFGQLRRLVLGAALGAPAPAPPGHSRRARHRQRGSEPRPAQGRHFATFD